MFGWNLCSKFNFIQLFPILANFAAILDHTKDNADVSNNDSEFQIYFYIFIKYAFLAPYLSLVAVPFTGQELDPGHFCLPQAN